MKIQSSNNWTIQFPLGWGEARVAGCGVTTKPLHLWHHGLNPCPMSLVGPHLCQSSLLPHTLSTAGSGLDPKDDTHPCQQQNLTWIVRLENLVNLWEGKFSWFKHSHQEQDSASWGCTIESIKRRTCFWLTCFCYWCLGGWHLHHMVGFAHLGAELGSFMHSPHPRVSSEGGTSSFVVPTQR